MSVAPSPSGGPNVPVSNDTFDKIVGNLAPTRIAHPRDPNDPLAGTAAFVPYDGSTPQPGDMLEFHTPTGVYQFLVAADGSYQMAGAPKAPARQAPSGGYQTSADLGIDPNSSWGKALDHAAQQLNDPNTSPSERNALLTLYSTALNNGVKANASNATLDANTRALAASAQQKINAGKVPTQGELEALNKVRAAGGDGGAGGQPSGGGTLADDLQRYGDEVSRLTGNPAAGQFAMAQALHETGGGKTWPMGANGPETATYNYAAWGGVGDSQGHPGYETPEQGAQAYVNWIRNNSNYAATWQAMTGGGSIQDIANTFATTTAGRWAEAGQQPDGSNPSYAQAILSAAGQLGNWGTTGGAQPSTGGSGGVTLPNLPTTPTVRNFGSTTTPDWRQYNASTGTWQPVSGLAGQVPETKNFGDANTPDWRQWDPTTKQWTPVVDANGVQLGQLPKAQIALQQYTQTVNYIYDQLKAGTFGADPAKAQQAANQYLGAAQQILTASLQGTTPYELQQAQIKQQQDQQTLAKDLLNQEMASGASMTNALLQSSEKTAGLAGYNPMRLAMAMGWTVPMEAAEQTSGPILQGLNNGANGGAANPTALPPLAALPGPVPQAPQAPQAPQPLHPLATALTSALTGQSSPGIVQALVSSPATGGSFGVGNAGPASLGEGDMMPHEPRPSVASLGGQMQTAANVATGVAT